MKGQRKLQGVKSFGLEMFSPHDKDLAFRTKDPL